MKLSEENYYSQKANKEFLSCSQIKDFIKCEYAALAKLNGEYEEEPSNALIQSSYIDEYFSGTLENFKIQHGELFKKDGDLKAEYKGLDDIIKQAEEDSMFAKYLKGEHQVIMTGKIANSPVKIKMDSYFKDKVIVDLKAVKDFDLLWDEKEKIKKNFIDYYDYIMQAAIYQEIVYQNTGKKLPFIIAAMTKEKISERALLYIPQEKMDEKLGYVSEMISHIQELKNGNILPSKCNHCDYCKSKAKTSKIIDYSIYFDERGGI